MKIPALPALLLFSLFQPPLLCAENADEKSSERLEQAEAPRSESRRSEPSNSETPSQRLPKEESKRPETKRSETPRSEAPRPESKQSGTPRSETPRGEARRPAAPREVGPDSRGTRNAAPRRPQPPQARGRETDPTKLPFLGVATTPLAPSLRDHLGLPHGFGIQVQQVEPGSPAAKAGIERHDVLVRFDDQRLISPEHLSLLVRSAKAGERVELSVVRRGEEQRLTATLGETDRIMFQRDGRPRHEDWQEQMRGRQDVLQDWMHRHHPAPRPPRFRHESGVGGDPDESVPEGEAAALLTNEAERESPTGRPPAISVRPGFPVSVFGAEGLVKIDNEQGEATLSFDGEEHRIELRDAVGALVHEGPWDPERGAEALPEKAQDHLRAMKLDELKLLEIRQADPTRPERTSDEAAEKAGEEGKAKIL